MEGRDFARAIVDGWDDPTPMDVFADYLEERGEADRAAMLRAGAAYRRLAAAVPATGRCDQIDTLWKNCVSPIQCLLNMKMKNVSCDRDLVMLRLTATSGAGIRRLVEIDGLPRLIADGWVSTCEFSSVTDAMVDTLEYRADTLRGVLRGVAIRAEPGRIGPATLSRLLRWAELVGLDLTRCISIGRQHAGELSRCDGLRALSVVPNWIDPIVRPLFFEAVGRLAGLRDLTILGRGWTDADLRAIAGLGSLRKLWIANGSLLTIGAVGSLQTMAGLRTLNIVESSPAVDAALDGWQRDRPDLRIERRTST